MSFLLQGNTLNSPKFPFSCTRLANEPLFGLVWRNDPCGRDDSTMLASSFPLGCVRIWSFLMDAAFSLTVGSFLLAVELFYLQLSILAFLLTLEMFCLQLELFYLRLAYSGKVRLIRALRDCKQRSLTVSKKNSNCK